MWPQWPKWNIWKCCLLGAQQISSLPASSCCWLRVAFVGENEFLMLPFIKLETKISSSLMQAASVQVSEQAVQWDIWGWVMRDTVLWCPSKGCDICSWLGIQPWFIRQPQEAAKHHLALEVLMVFFRLGVSVHFLSHAVSDTFLKLDKLKIVITTQMKIHDLNWDLV